jgi:hypothetical protein
MSLTSYVNTQAVSITFAATPLAANHCLAVRLAVIDGDGRDYYKNLLKLVKVSAGAQATGLDVGPQCLIRFGTPIAGQRVWCECEVWDKATGLVSGRSCASTVVLASAP